MRAAVQGPGESDHGKRNIPHLIIASGFIAVVLGGRSNYVKRTGFDSTVAELRATDQRLQGRIDALSQ